MRWAWILAILLMVIGLAPAGGMLLASGVSALADCPINAAFPQPCVILGADIGGSLNVLFTSGWLMFLTAPAALTGFALAIGLAGFSLLRRARSD